MANEPQVVSRQFYGEITEPVSCNKITMHIVISEGKGVTLLSKNDSIWLGVIRNGPQASHISMNQGDELKKNT